MENYEFFGTNLLEQFDEADDETVEAEWADDELVDEFYDENHDMPDDTQDTAVELEYYDAYGNRVDEEGNRIDNNGNPLPRDDFGNPIGNAEPLQPIQVHVIDVPPIEG